MTPTEDARLVRLGDALHAAAAADLARAGHGVRRRRLPRRLAAGLVVAAVVIPSAAVAATQLFGADDVARSMPAGTLMLAGTEPKCTVVRDQVEYRCTLTHAPTGEIAPGAFHGTVEATVDAHGIVNGGCRSLDPDGRAWSCYLGQEAVAERIIGPALLGQHSTGPSAG
ncbi:MAG TPA: hypothetical protein VGO71_02985 [Baekduia sp.]|jgi:hypothetical protein|nr:hypothetical protein [Baekduia sp.]